MLWLFGGQKIVGKLEKGGENNGLLKRDYTKSIGIKVGMGK